MGRSALALSMALLSSFVSLAACSVANLTAAATLEVTVTGLEVGDEVRLEVGDQNRVLVVDERDDGAVMMSLSVEDGAHAASLYDWRTSRRPEATGSTSSPIRVPSVWRCWPPAPSASIPSIYRGLISTASSRICWATPTGESRSRAT